MRRTFDEWKAHGYHVVKGQKAVGKNAHGVAVFDHTQVEGGWSDERDYEGSEEEALGSWDWYK
jgi:hypothetical protein